MSNSLGFWKVLFGLSVSILCLSGAFTSDAAPLGTKFTYQGYIEDAGVPASGNFDLQFRIYDGPNPATATLLGTHLECAVGISDGLFTAELDFGAIFSGDALWLEVGVAPSGPCNGSTAFTTLSPLQALTATPYALFALEGNQGPPGPQGPPGEDGEDGAPGASPFTLNGNDVVYTLGNIGLGVSAPDERLDVNGNIEFTGKLQGSSCTASGEDAVALGGGTTASGLFSVALGQATTASGQRDTALGNNTHASGGSSLAAGSFTEAQAFASVSMGSRTRAQAFGSLALGRFNVGGGTPTSWRLGDPALEIGNGDGENSRSNAMTVFNNGNVTIAGSLTQSSDVRLKKEITPLSNILNRLLALRGVSFHWNTATAPHQGQRIGLVAQEVEQVFPELVRTDATGWKSVDYAGLVTPLLEAVKEQHSIIEQLRQVVCADQPRESLCVVGAGNGG